MPRTVDLKRFCMGVQDALKSTKASVLDYVVFSLPELPTTLICLQEMYIMLEALVDKHIIKNIILSEIMDEYFIDLYNWAKVKPGIQVYWGKDFVLPPTLENFIEQNSVQLLKHKDPRVILPHNVLDLTLMEIDHPMGSEYATQWVARIDVSDANSGELKRRGRESANFLDRLLMRNEFPGFIEVDSAFIQKRTCAEHV
ncbi:glutamate--cysteine ligase regulatory subunit-like [Hetaerina americana]|uniref:glutamate--cysteine ligase regulatory subunit-like n=1 Tax=Hetaerina americana TaxID=62018 RepID=UPI003A7F5316